MVRNVRRVLSMGPAATCLNKPDSPPPPPFQLGRICSARKTDLRCLQQRLNPNHPSLLLQQSNFPYPISSAFRFRVGTVTPFDQKLRHKDSQVITVSHIMLLNVTQVTEVCHQRCCTGKNVKQQFIPHREKLLPIQSTLLKAGFSGTFIIVSLET